MENLKADSEILGKRYSKTGSSSLRTEGKRNNLSLCLQKKTTEIVVYENIHFGKKAKTFIANRKIKKESLPQDKPIVQVTVDEEFSTKIRQRKRKNPILLQNSVSQHTSVDDGTVPSCVRKSDSTSVITKKVDLVNRKNPETLSDLKSLINSLNMNKRKKKIKENDKNQNIANEITFYEPPKAYDHCNCYPTQSITQPGDEGKSRVRITGRLGLTEDDKYVLKCAATIDGHPIETRFSERLSPSTSIDRNNKTFENSGTTANIAECWPFNCSKATNRAQKNVQAQTEPNRFDFSNPHDAVYSICNKGSQGTQVDLKLLFRNCDDMYNNSKTEEMGVQCGCSKQENGTVNYIDKTIDVNVLSMDKTVGKSPTNNSFRNPRFKVGEDVKGNENKSVTNAGASLRNWSPRAFNSKEVDVQTSENKQRKSRPLSSSPTRFSGHKNASIRTNSDTKINAQRPSSLSPVRKTKKNSSSAKDSTVKSVNKITKQSQRRDKSPDFTKKNINPQFTKQINASIVHSDNTKQLNTRSSDNKRSEHAKKTNNDKKGESLESKSVIDRNRAKKALNRHKTLEVEKIAKKTKSKKEDKSCSCGNVSRIKINIDSLKDQYDLLFQKNCDSTGLTVMKKTKSRPLSGDEGDSMSLSLENFLVNTDENRKRSISQAMVENESKDNADVNPPAKLITAGIQVRDSIEIKHIRESKNSASIDQPSFNSLKKYNCKDIRINNYKGDDFEIINSANKDKGIRNQLQKKAKPHKELKLKAAVIFDSCSRSLMFENYTTREHNLIYILVKIDPDLVGSIWKNYKQTKVQQLTTHVDTAIAFNQSLRVTKDDKPLLVSQTFETNNNKIISNHDKKLSPELVDRRNNPETNTTTELFKSIQYYDKKSDSSEENYENESIHEESISQACLNNQICGRTYQVSNNENSFTDPNMFLNEPANSKHFETASCSITTESDDYFDANNLDSPRGGHSFEEESRPKKTESRVHEIKTSAKNSKRSFFTMFARFLTNKKCF